MVVQFRKLDYMRDWDWVRKFLPLVRCEGGTGIAAYDGATGELQAAMVAESWTETSVIAHLIVANKMVLRHRFLEECAWYVYTYCDRILMYGHVRSDNEAAIRFDKHIGFTELIRLKDGYEVGVDDVIMEMHRDNCPFWQPEDMRRMANG